MPTARFLDIELANADIDHYEALEGNIYFAASTVNMKYLKPSDLVTTCGWKGDANYFDVVYTNQDGVECKNANAAWVYRTPKKGAEHIKDHISFWKGIVFEGYDPIDIIVRELKRRNDIDAIKNKESEQVHVKQESTE